MPPIGPNSGIWLGSGDLSLRKPRDYRGRVGAAIPTAGIILPGAKGGIAPYTYALTNFPVGLAFAAGTRAITGSPTGTYATREVTYTVTDSATPAAVATQTFEFPVVGSTAAITRDDWDNRGYRLETRTTYLLALLQGTVAVGSGNVTVWRRPPQSGASVGLLLDDDGNAITDLADMTLTAFEQTNLISRIIFLVSQDRVELRKTGTPTHLGTYISSTLGSPALYMRTLDDGEQVVPYDRGFTSNAQFRRGSPDLGAFLQSIDNGVRWLLAVAST